VNIKQWNDNVLRRQGVNSKSAYPKAVVRVVGDAKKATLIDGTIVERVEHIYVAGYGLIKCCPYELHFIYELPKHLPGWGLMCTCGSIAGVVGYGAYSRLLSPTASGHIIVCVRHTTVKNNDGFGEHADGSHE
jgi:hypothetical protein